MEIVIVGGIVAAAAGVLVAQFRRKLRGDDRSCDGEDGKCSGCAGSCVTTSLRASRPDGVPPTEAPH